MPDKDLAVEVDAALEALSSQEREQLEREGGVRAPADLLELGFE
jgi:hypothetical protein